MTKLQTASERIVEEATSWPGVTAEDGSRGELSLRFGRREIGHLHGDHALHIGFPKAVWTDLHGQGRIDYHPVFPGKPGYAARRIEGDDDVRDVIALLRLNYDRAAAKHGVPESPIPGLHPSDPETLPFDTSFEIRAFLLERERGNLLLYSVAGLQPGTAPLPDGADVARHYLNHWHEALFAPATPIAPLFVHEEERDHVAERHPVRGAFSRRHALDEDFEVIPMPGHTPGATAYLWDSGAHRVLFTGDTIYVDDGEWVAGLLESSDRASLIESLELVRELDFDVLVPWTAKRGEPWHAFTDGDDRRRRIDAMLDELRSGEERR